MGAGIAPPLPQLGTKGNSGIIKGGCAEHKWDRCPGIGGGGDFETGLMNVRPDRVGEMLVLSWHGQGHLQRQLERKCLTVILDGADGDGSLKAVRGTHGGSPYWYNGCPSCVLFFDG